MYKKIIIMIIHIYEHVGIFILRTYKNNHTIIRIISLSAYVSDSSFHYICRYDKIAESFAVSTRFYRRVSSRSTFLYMRAPASRLLSDVYSIYYTTELSRSCPDERNAH